MRIGEARGLFGPRSSCAVFLGLEGHPCFRPGVPTPWWTSPPWPSPCSSRTCRAWLSWSTRRTWARQAATCRGRSGNSSRSRSLSSSPGLPPARCASPTSARPTRSLPGSCAGYRASKATCSPAGPASMTTGTTQARCPGSTELPRGSSDARVPCSRRQIPQPGPKSSATSWRS